MRIEKAQRPKKVRGKWDFIPKLSPEDCLVFDTIKEADNARRAIYWHGFKPISRKTREGWKVWKTLERNS